MNARIDLGTLTGMAGFAASILFLLAIIVS